MCFNSHITSHFSWSLQGQHFMVSDHMINLLYTVTHFLLSIWSTSSIWLTFDLKLSNLQLFEKGGETDLSFRKWSLISLINIMILERHNQKFTMKPERKPPPDQANCYIVKIDQRQSRPLTSREQPAALRSVCTHKEKPEGESLSQRPVCHDNKVNWLKTAEGFHLQ